jgi:replicative DNA helicase
MIDPQNVEAEKALIGSVFMDNSCYLEASSIVRAEDFYDSRNREVWATFGKLNEAGTPMDVMTVSVSFSDLAYLATLMNAVPTAGRALYYAQIVADASARRKMLVLASNVAMMAHNPDLDVLEAVGRIQKGAEGLSGSRIAEITLSDQLTDLITEVSLRRLNPKDIWGIPIGIDKIDKATGGQQKGELTICFGRPKIGKSMFAGQIVPYAASQGFHAGIYSLEMRNKQVLRRQIAALSGLDTKKMRSGHITDFEFQQFVQACDQMAKLPMFIVDESGLTVDQIRADVNRRNKKRKVDMIVVDYIGLIGSSEQDPNEKENAITIGLKRMAQREDVAVFAIHSVNKGGLDGKPDLKAGSGPSKNIHNADNIYFFCDHTPSEKGEQPNPNMRTLFCPAMRDAPGLHSVDLVMEAGKPRFVERALPGAFGPEEPPDYWQH